MKNKNFKLTFLGAALCFALTGCSNDDSTESTNNNSESGVVSNGEITLTYGSDLLNHYVHNLNESLNLEGVSGASARYVGARANYVSLNESNAISITNDAQVPQNTELNSGTYILNAGESSNKNFKISGSAKLILKGDYTGNLNLNGGELHILKNMTSLGNINLNGGNIFVAPNMTVTINKNLNQGTLTNFGKTTFTEGSTNGNIINNDDFTFTQAVNLNSSIGVTNNCKMTFLLKPIINSNTVLENNSFIEFKGGFTINSNGTLQLNLHSYTKVTGGSIGYDGTINGVITVPNNEFTPRLDINNASLSNINGTERITGIIDINSNFNASQLRAKNTVLFNQNTFVPVSDCTLGAGNSTTVGCSIVDLKNNAKHIAFLDSPVVNGIKLSATDVRVEGNKAYVSYHTNDEVYGTIPYGSVRVIDLNSSTNKLEIVREANFNNCEFNALTYSNSNIYAVGNNLDGSRMFTAALDADKNITNNLDAIWSYKFPSAGGKSVSLDSSGNLWVAAGNTNGGLFKLTPQNNTFDINRSLDQAGSKYVTFNSDNTKQVFFALKNGNPYLRISSGDGTFIDEYTDTNITLTNRDGKNTIAIDGDFIYVALSEQGVAKYKLSDGSFVAKFVPMNYRNASGAKVFKKNGLTNAVTTDGCFIYLANGADGVIILDKATFTYASHFNTGLDKSTNFVYASGNYLFVATGRDGLNVIKIK